MKKINQQIRNLKYSLEKLKAERTNCKPRCRFEWSCKKKAFCKYDHKYLYSRVNKNNLTPAEKNLSCELCGKCFKSRDICMKHSENCIVVPVEITNIQSGNYGNVFSSISNLRKNNEKEHLREALECTKYEQIICF